MALELHTETMLIQLQHLSIQGVFRPGGTLPMAICRPEAAMRMAICTTLSSPQSSRNRVISSRLSRKNHTNNSWASSSANIYFDNAAFISDNSFCEIPHSSTAHIMPSVAEIRNHGKQVRETILAETFFFSPMRYLAAARKVGAFSETGRLRAPQMAGRGFARAVAGWVWRGGIPAPPEK